MKITMFKYKRCYA